MGYVFIVGFKLTCSSLPWLLLKAYFPNSSGNNMNRPWRKKNNKVNINFNRQSFKHFSVFLEELPREKHTKDILALYSAYRSTNEPVETRPNRNKSIKLAHHHHRMATPSWISPHLNTQCILGINPTPQVTQSVSANCAVVSRVSCDIRSEFIPFSILSIFLCCIRKS